MITGTTANLGGEHTMTCVVEGDNTGLQYEWRVGSSLLQFTSSDNTYVFPMVVASNGRSDYSCRVFDAEGTEVGTGTASLRVISKPLCCPLLSPHQLTPPPPPPLIAVPDFEMRILRFSDVSISNYVGLNVSYVCSTLFTRTLDNDLSGDVVIFGPDNTSIQEGDERVTTSTVTKSRNDYERAVYFSPLSVIDMGDYRCTGVISSSVPNALVTNGTGTVVQSVTVFGERQEGKGEKRVRAGA